MDVMVKKRKKHLNADQVTRVDSRLIRDMVKTALSEDIATGDINVLLIDEATCLHARVITREAMILCGSAWVDEVFNEIDPAIRLIWYKKDGDRVSADEVIFGVQGSARSILSAERCALNFLQLLSAVATITDRYVDAIAHTHSRVLDTRKTIPGFRLAQKYAVTCGGGVNHRIGLFDAFLIKENHIAACDHSITQAVAKARVVAPEKMVEVEVETILQLKEALAADVDVIMLDNFSLDQMREAVELTEGRAVLEASGNVDLNNIAAIAETGVDYISIGGLTKNIQAIDLSMRYV